MLADRLRVGERRKAVSSSHVERAGREDLVERNQARGEALLVHVLRDGCQNRSRRLEAVGERIMLGERALGAGVEQSALEVPMQIRPAVARDLLLRRHEGRVEVERYPGMALEERTPHHHRVIDREQPGLGVEAAPFGGGIWKEIACDARDVDRAAVDQVLLEEIVQRAVELAPDEHLPHVRGRRDLVHAHAGGRGEAGGTAVALVGVALHEPFDLARMHPELVLQDAALPDRPGLLIFRHADALAAQVGRCRDPRIGPHDDAGVEELAHGEDRDRHEARVAARGRDDQRRHRHFRHVELGEAQLPPEHLGGMHHGGDELDPLRRHAAFEQRAGTLVVGERDAELQMGVGHGSLSPPRKRGPMWPFATVSGIWVPACAGTTKRGTYTSDQFSAGTLTWTRLSRTRTPTGRRRYLGSPQWRPVSMSNSQPCQGQTMFLLLAKRSPRLAWSGPNSSSTRGMTLPWQTGPPSCGQ